MIFCIYNTNYIFVTEVQLIFLAKLLSLNAYGKSNLDIVKCIPKQDNITAEIMNYVILRGEIIL